MNARVPSELKVEPIVFSEEPFSEGLLDELFPLLEAHYKEIAHYKDIPLSPDLALYEIAYKTGMLRIYTARRGKSIVGYSVFFVRPHGHYKTSLQAVQDILFLSPSERGKMLGARLIRFSDERLKEIGVQAVYHHVKESHNFGPLLERLGYQQVERIYTRRLD